MRRSLHHEPIGFTTLLHDVLNARLGSTYASILWYLPKLIGLYLIYPLLFLLKERSRKGYLYLTLLVGFFTVGLGFLHRIAGLLLADGHGTYFSEFLGFLSTFSPQGFDVYLTYFLLGGLASLYQKKIRKLWWLFLILALLLYLSSLGYSIWLSNKTGRTNTVSLYASLTMCFLLLSAFSLLSRIRIENPCLLKIAKGLGKTFGPYMIHMIVLDLVVRFHPWVNDAFLNNFCNALLSFVSSYLIVFLLGRFRPIRYLFGR